MAAVGRDGLIGSELRGAHGRLRFARSVRARLGGIVAAESQCCAFLAMEVVEERGGVTLTIDGPEGSEVVVAELVTAFGALSDRRPGAPEARPRAPRHLA
jgi:hypothetical protein